MISLHFLSAFLTNGYSNRGFTSRIKDWHIPFTTIDIILLTKMASNNSKYSDTADLKTASLSNGTQKMHC